MPEFDNRKARGPEESRHGARGQQIMEEKQRGFTLPEAMGVIVLATSFVLLLCVTFLGLAGLWGGIGSGALLKAHPDSLAASMGTTPGRILVVPGSVAVLLGLKRAVVSISQSLQIILVVAVTGLLLTADPALWEMIPHSAPMGLQDV